MKGFTLLLSMVALVAAGISGVLYWKVEDRKAALTQQLDTASAQLTSARQRADELAKERDGLKDQLAALGAEVNEIKARNTTLEARNSQLSREITQAREQLTTRSSADQTSAARIEDLNRQLVEARAAASARAGGANAEQVAAYEARIADLESQLASVRRAAESATARDPLADVPADLSGTVIDVGARAAFLALDVGSRNGAVPGLELTIRRNAVVVARVRLTTVNETYSIASILPRTGTGNVRPGDIAARP